ncbi:MAG: hypothetical protein J5921_03290, partial [Clostridia bacterium]|nr:hypothetical protein [Clostridia bacterium]
TNKSIATKASERADVSQVADDFILAFRDLPASTVEAIKEALNTKYGEQYTFDWYTQDTVNIGCTVSENGNENPLMKLVFDDTGKLIEYYGKESLSTLPGGDETLNGD